MRPKQQAALSGNSETATTGHRYGQPRFVKEMILEHVLHAHDEQQ